MAQVLLIDDSNLAIGRLATVVSKAGHRVIASAYDGAVGSEMYRQHRPDLVLLDCTMPVRNGLQCLRDIVEFDRAARVLMLDAGRDADQIADCLRYGAVGVAQKPTGDSSSPIDRELMFAISDALANGEAGGFG